MSNNITALNTADFMNRPVLPAVPAPRKASGVNPSQLTTRMAALKLGMLNHKAGFQPVPVALQPWFLTKKQWQQATAAAVLLGRLLAAVAKDAEFLLQQFQPVLLGDSLPAKLAAAYAQQQQQALPQRAGAVFLMRHDLMLNEQQQWQWIESNSIAAGMGPLSVQLGALLQPEQPDLAPNNATELQANLLYREALAQAQKHGRLTPQIVFVVEAQEDNIFDQQLLADALIRRGALVERCTIAELYQQQLRGQQGAGKAAAAVIDEASAVTLNGSRVDLLYFRTGYNPADFANAQQFAWRCQLQQQDVLLCPDLPTQLAGSKWLQLQLSGLLQQEQGRVLLASRFGFHAAELQQLCALTVPAKPLLALEKPQVEQLIQAGWWFKKQNEGGGNVARGEQALQLAMKAKPQDGDFLMAPVLVQQRPEPLLKFQQGRLIQQQAHISELGIFSLGATADYGGYLLRTKAAAALEGGVHKGNAVLDTVALGL